MRKSTSFEQVLGRTGGFWQFEELLPMAGTRLDLGEVVTPIIHLQALHPGGELLMKDGARIPVARRRRAEVRRRIGL